MANELCSSCDIPIDDHTKEESIICALKLCNGKEVADSACGINEPLDQKPTRSYRRSVSS